MKINQIAIITSVLALLTTGVFAQSPKGAEQLRSRPVAMEKTSEVKRTSAIVNPHSGVTYSVHSRGFLQNPKTGEVTAELVTFRERGLFGNGSLVQMLLNDEGQPLVVLSSSSSAGPATAIIQGASFVGGMYVFSENLRPNKSSTTVNGGNANSGSVSSATAKGGNADASNVNVNANSATATGGNATGGNATGGNGNGGHNPPGHQPGHGQPGHGND